MNQENYTEAIVNAEAAFSNDNYELALKWYTKALAEDPNALEALSRAGAVCVALDKYDEAFDYFKKAMDIDPENGDNAFNLGNAYFFHGEYGKALELYAEAENMNCDENVKVRLYYQMALICSIRNDLKGALINFDKYESYDESGLLSLNPDLLSEKIKIYIALEEYEKAEKCAVQWVAVAPDDLRSYMVYFSILMADANYTKAEKIIEDAEKYAETDKETMLSLQMEKVALYVAMDESEPENSEKPHIQKAFAILTELCQENPNNDELRLTMAELSMKLNWVDKAIETALSLIPNDEITRVEIHHSEAEYVELDDMEIEEMVENDMAAVEEKIESGEISEDIVDSAEVYYDEDGKAVREYPEGVFDDFGEEAVDETAGETESESEEPTVNERTSDFYDRLYFVLLSCYATIEDYSNARKFGKLLKNSDNIYYSYFGRYTEVFSMKKLSETSSEVTKEAAERAYEETIAFYRSSMMKNPGDNFAVIFRARMYAESGKFFKAEEMANLLSADEKDAVMVYIEQCRKEHQSM